MSDLFIDKNIDPMLLYETEPFDSDEHIFELKLDGIRCIAYIEPKSVVLQNKRHKDVTDIYPELSDMKKCVKKRVILDGELVVLIDGKPNFYALQKRSLMSDEFRIKLAAKNDPVQFVAYDILYLDGKDLTDKPLMERKEMLNKAVTEGHGLSVSRYIEKNGKDFFELAKQEQLEGIVAKQKDGLYHIGKRTHDWVKIKVMQDEDLFVCGYQPDEYGNVKDLILGYYDDNDKLQCRGKVYLGVSESDRKIIGEFAKKNTVKRPWFEKYKNAVWLKPELIGTAHFMHETESGGMRQPEWKGLRVD
ncbi:MAG: ATP-dependent DNA ligase [Clostridia bacterium]|jgi:bifunctional non-homologous end joining protein LigD|nr:ATP-dependent DNA ligase [Clostridia bacterium]MCI9460197.1 ATP-dependent DNA ligase [Clostridia bacterium]